MHKNVVLIMTDQQKASSLPMYGNPTVKTPNLARLAGDGALFNNAYTSQPICVPARVSTFTGQYASTHGSLSNEIPMLPGKLHLARILKERGFATGLVGKNHCFRDEDIALFDTVRECGHYGPKGVDPDTIYARATRFLHDAPELKAAWGHVVNPFPPEALGTAWTTDRAVEFVRAHATEPFFLWYSIPDPHIPFQTAEPYASMYDPNVVDLPPRREGEMAGKPRCQRLDHDVMRGAGVTDRTIREIVALYYGMNTFIDTELGRFLEELARLDLDESTMIVYVSDHGEYLGEHEMIRKSKAAYDCLTHIPFIVRLPASERAAAQRIDAFVSLEDVMPTILSFLGISIPRDVQGRDLMPLLRGEPFDDRRFAYGEYGIDADPVPETTPVIRCASPLSPDFTPRLKIGRHGKMRYLRDSRYKLVAYVRDLWELYDIETDPWELENRIDDPALAPVLRRLSATLVEHVMRINGPLSRASGE